MPRFTVSIDDSVASPRAAPATATQALPKVGHHGIGRANATGLKIVETFSDRRDRFIPLTRGTPEADVVL